MTLDLRAARALDAGFVGGLLTGFVADTPWMPRLHSGAEDVAHADMMIARGWVTLAHLQGAPCGFLARDGGFIHALYVRDNARNQGVGARLLQSAQLKQNALTLWTFQANTGAQRFYLRQGFAEAERSDGARNDENLPDIRYEWQQKGAHP